MGKITKKSFTCIVCPVGCRLEATLDDGKVVGVEGNSCPRGKKYATDELTNPTRTLTSAVKIDGYSEKVPGLKLLPVKTDKPIPKDKLFEGMKQIRALTVKPPMAAGTIVCRDFVCEGVNLVGGRDI